MATASPKLALRPFLAEDAPLLAEIFRDSILDLTGDDYSEAQQEARIERAEDLEAFAGRLGGALTLIATLEGSPVAFASLVNNSKIDMLYVHPAASGQGAAKILIDALEKLAGARGAAKLTVDASDTAMIDLLTNGAVEPVGMTGRTERGADGLIHWRAAA